jgi:hypothetical protein
MLEKSKGIEKENSLIISNNTCGNYPIEKVHVYIYIALVVYTTSRRKKRIYDNSYYNNIDVDVFFQ